MADKFNPPVSSYPSPLTGYENAPPIGNDALRRHTNNKVEMKNPPNDKLSNAYDRFPGPIEPEKGGFDVHICYFQSNKAQEKYARQLWERVRREFPELCVYSFNGEPEGPFPVAQFEVNLSTPAQFGAFVPWLAVWRGPLSILVHPNTTEEGDGSFIERRNHSQRAIWMGERIPLDMSMWERDGRQG